MASAVIAISDNSIYKDLLDIHDPDFSFSNEQLAFLKKNSSDILLRAVPGSGKTTMLTYKAMQLLRQYSHIKKIQCISYTNVTVGDIEKKCHELLSRNELDRIDFSTFHGFCLEYIIRPFAHLYCSPGGMRIYSELFTWEKHGQDFLELLRQKNVPANKVSYIQWSKAVHYKIILTEDNQIDWEAVFSDSNGNEAMLKCYRAFLASRHLIDFNLVLFFALRLVLENSLVQEAVNASFDYIIIDEFQDITDIQYQIVQLLLSARGTSGDIRWILIGDPNQSIYAFAGANMKSMYNMKNYLTELDGEDCEIALKNSYRCSEGVFSEVRRVYNQNLKKFSDSLAANSPGSEEIREFIGYLTIDERVSGHGKGGTITYEEVRDIEDGICFIGSDKFDTLSTYNKQRQLRIELSKDSEYLHFHNILDTYKQQYGYRFIALFTSYLTVKYNFYNSLHDFEDSLEEYMYLFHKTIQEDLGIDYDSAFLITDYCLNLDVEISGETNLLVEYKSFHERVCVAVDFPSESLGDEIEDRQEKYRPVVDFSHFVEYLKIQKSDARSIEIKHLHKIKGLQYKEIILKTDKIPHTSKRGFISALLNSLVGCANLTETNVLECIEELNKLYVMMTRSESNVYILSNDASLFLAAS